MSKTGGGIFNTSKIKSKNRYGLNKKYKGKDIRNKKDGLSYRSKCKNPDVSFDYKTLKDFSKYNNIQYYENV